MGYEIRRVPSNWNHPKDNKNKYVPLLKWDDENLNEILVDQAERYDSDPKKYGRGLSRKKFLAVKKKEILAETMPNWKEKEKTHFVMYENVTEGTPISPPFKTKSELARWLSKNHTLFTGKKAPYRNWMAVIENGCVVSFSLYNSQLKTGVEDIVS